MILKFILGVLRIAHYRRVELCGLGEVGCEWNNRSSMFDAKASLKKSTGDQQDTSTPNFTARIPALDIADS